MPILNYKQYGEAMSLRWPFTAEEVEEEIELIASIKYDKQKRLKRQPKAIDLTGLEFMAFCEQFRTLSETDFIAYRTDLYQKQQSK